jgi:hypothetical protein
MRDTAQIVFAVFILVLAIALIPLVYVYGITFLDSELGAQCLVAGFGFIILVFQLCLFMLYAPSS